MSFIYYPENDNNLSGELSAASIPHRKLKAGNSPSYYYYAPVDNEVGNSLTYQSSYKTTIDNGKIFAFAEKAVLARNVTPTNSAIDGDLFVSSHGYAAMISTLLHYSNQTFEKDFDLICSDDTSTPKGCAIFSVQFHGKDDRSISKFDFQVSTDTKYMNIVQRHGCH